MSVLGLGTDIVEISRVASVSESSERFAKRVLAESELNIYKQHTQPERYLAKRWAAKEAAAKALGTGIGRGISFHHFITTNNELGAPKLQLVGKALEVANTMGVTSVLLSISDEKHYATATVILS
jgi:holo-[acyl-carrier protein] synthase